MKTILKRLIKTARHHLYFTCLIILLLITFIFVNKLDLSYPTYFTALSGIGTILLACIAYIEFKDFKLPKLKILIKSWASQIPKKRELVLKNQNSPNLNHLSNAQLMELIELYNVLHLINLECSNEPKLKNFRNTLISKNDRNIYMEFFKKFTKIKIQETLDQKLNPKEYNVNLDAENKKIKNKMSESALLSGEEYNNQTLIQDELAKIKISLDTLERSNQSHLSMHHSDSTAPSLGDAARGYPKDKKAFTNEKKVTTKK